MDVIAGDSGDGPPKVSNISLNNDLGSFYNDVLIKQEVPDVEATPLINATSYEPLKDELKLEQHRLNLRAPQLERLHDNFLIVRGPDNERRYGCHLCNFHTKHKVSLYRHIKLHTPEEMQSYRCDLCGFATLYRRHLDVHIKVLHTSEADTKPYKCDQCTYECNYRENLSRHKKTHLSPEERCSFVCQICDFETYYRRSYRVHMEMIHPQIIIAKTKPEEAEEFKCYHCPFETKYRVNIVRHLKTHMKGDARVYKCADCDFQTIHKTNFNTHVLRHKDPSKIKIFACQHCSHTTFYKASLRNHLKLHMKKEEIETYKCDSCDFATIYERSLKLHVLYMHNGDHQAIEHFKCHFCDFETRYRENWRRHEKGHMKPGKQDTYSCTECSFSTIQQGRYERHLLSHASAKQLLPTPRRKRQGKKRFRAVIDQPYSLSVIDSAENDFKPQTFSKGNLTMFQCCHCSYKTLNKQLLDEHLSSHNIHSKNTMDLKANGATPNTKVFNCERCPFTTIHKSSMRRHRETHLRPSERKEYKCPTCVFRSYTRARVNSHECPNRDKNADE